MTVSSAGRLSPGLLLEAWDRASVAPEAARGAVVLATASGLAPDALVDVPLSELEHVAARCLRESFDDSLDVVLFCDACGEQLELSVPLALLLAEGDPGSSPAPVASAPAPGVRPPTTRDLLAAIASADPAGTMLRRCTVPSEAGDDPGTDGDARRRASTALDEAAGDALTALVSECPGCGTRVDGVLDACTLLWDAVADEAPRLLRDVAALATAFGWTEREVLALPPARRTAYLGLVGA